MGRDGLEPPEAEANSFTDCTATNYGIPAQKSVGWDSDSQCLPRGSVFYRHFASAFCIPTVNNIQFPYNNSLAYFSSPLLFDIEHVTGFEPAWCPAWKAGVQNHWTTHAYDKRLQRDLNPYYSSVTGKCHNQLGDAAIMPRFGYDPILRFFRPVLLPS